MRRTAECLALFALLVGLVVGPAALRAVLYG
jgi:hypothetical protein